jgi:Methyltransferase domain
MNHMTETPLRYMRKREMVKGMATFIPFLKHVVQKRDETGGTDSARYCYSVWLRHLSMAQLAGLDTHPKIIAELGPGDSLGIGLAGLLSGSEQYYGLDVVRYANFSRNLRIFDELVEMFRNREPIPGPEEFPNVKPALADYRFPSFLDKSRLDQALHPDRIAAIRMELEGQSNATKRIAYFAPWDSPDVVRPGSVDLVFSQAVLEHVEDLPRTYQALALWLKPEGFMSHTIDFKAHHTSRIWNGHWAYSPFFWKLMKGRRVFLLNRKPRSEHLRLLKDSHFQILGESRSERNDGLSAHQLARGFQDFSKSDATTAGTFILARLSGSEFKTAEDKGLQLQSQ